MNGPDDRQKEDWTYYYALYHMLAHWGGFSAIFVLLVTLGVQWNVANPRVPYPRMAVFGLAILCAVELHLVWRIYKESDYLLRKLPIAERPAELVEPLHEYKTLIFSFIGLGTVGFAVWDIVLVLRANG